MKKMVLILSIILTLSGCSANPKSPEIVEEMRDISVEVAEKIDELKIDVELNEEKTKVLVSEGFVKFSMAEEDFFLEFEDFIDLVLKTEVLDDNSIKDTLIDMGADKEPEVLVPDATKKPVGEKDKNEKPVSKPSNKPSTDKPSADKPSTTPEKPNSGGGDVTNKPGTGGSSGGETKPPVTGGGGSDTKPDVPNKPGDKTEWVKVDSWDVDIPYKTSRVDDNSYPKGYEFVSTRGKMGYKEVFKYCLATNGIRDMNNCKEEVVKTVNPTHEVITVGTRVDEVRFEYSSTSYNNELLALVNKHRAANGKYPVNQAPMSWDSKSASVLKDRLQILIDYREKTGRFPEEHIGQIYIENMLYTTGIHTPQRIFDMYKGSPGHNSVMLGGAVGFSTMTVTKYKGNVKQYSINVMQFVG